MEKDSFVSSVTHMDGRKSLIFSTRYPDSVLMNYDFWFTIFRHSSVCAVEERTPLQVLILLEGSFYERNQIPTKYEQKLKV